MTFWGDERAQPVQIGFILLLAMLVLAFSSYQAFAVPEQNERVEFQHFQTVENEFTELRSTVVSAVGSDTTQSVSLTLGTQYPVRLLALNPPPVSGTLRTTEARPVTVENGTGTAKNICGSGATSRSLVYRPGFNEFESPEAISLENTFVTSEFRDGTRFGDQRLVDADEDSIDLLLLNGSVTTEDRGAFGVDVTASDRYSEAVSNPNVTLPSRFSADTWETEILSGVDGVNGVSSAGTGLVTIDFAGEFTVSCAVAGLNTDPAFSPPARSGTAAGAYAVEWQTDLSSVAPNSEPVVEVKVTDSDGDPVDGATVDFATADRTVANFTAGNSTAVTDDRGIASTTLTAGGGGETTVFAAAGDGVDVAPVEVVNDPPEASIDAVRDESVCTGGNNCRGVDRAEFDVDWSATDDTEIQSVEVELVDSDGNVVDTATPAASGTSASGTETLSEDGGFGEDYTIRLVVTDSAGQQDTDTASDTADGIDP